MSTIPDAPPQAGVSDGTGRPERGAWTTLGLAVLGLVVGCLLVIAFVSGATRVSHYLHARHHPTAFSGFGYGAGATVPVGTPVTFSLTPNPWRGDHGTLHVRAVSPVSVGDLPQGTTVTVWRCSRSDVGSPGGPILGEGPLSRHCTDARQVVGPFDLDATRGSRDALVLSVSSRTPTHVGFETVRVDYSEGGQSGTQRIQVRGAVRFVRR